MNGAAENGKPQQQKSQLHKFTLKEEQKASELEWERHEQELNDWKESCDAQRLADQSQQENGTQENAEPEQLEQWSSESLAKLSDWKDFQTFQQWQVNLTKDQVDAWKRELELELERQEARRTFKVFQQVKVDDIELSIDFCQRRVESTQARGKVDDGLVYGRPRIYKNKIGFLQRRLDNAYREQEEVGNNNTHLEFKRYKEKCDSDVKDAQDNIKCLKSSFTLKSLG